MKMRLWKLTAIILTVLSSCLFVLTMLFWIRSITIGDMLTWRRAPHQCDVLSLNGIVQVGGGEMVSAFPAPEGWTGSFWPFHRATDNITSDTNLWRGTWFGFHYEQTHRHTPTFSIDYHNCPVIT